MHKLDIKPLSVNEAWKGRRFKTDKYKVYERSILLLLPRLDVPKGPLKLTINWGFSSSGADTDNPIKPFVDCLQKKYSFNDNKVYDYRVTKEIVKKGKEFIQFRIESIEDLV